MFMRDPKKVGTVSWPAKGVGKRRVLNICVGQNSTPSASFMKFPSTFIQDMHEDMQHSREEK